MKPLRVPRADMSVGEARLFYGLLLAALLPLAVAVLLPSQLVVLVPVAVALGVCAALLWEGCPPKGDDSDAAAAGAVAAPAADDSAAVETLQDPLGST